MINYKTNANDTDENINVYNSAMKGYLDNWYKKNLTAYESSFSKGFWTKERPHVTKKEKKEDVIPFKWSKDVLDGNSEVILHFAKRIIKN